MELVSYLAILKVPQVFHWNFI